MKTSLVVVEPACRARTLKAYTSTVLSIIFYHPPQLRPKPEPVWWQLHVHLEDSSLFCIHKGENSTFCLLDVFILCENCLQLLLNKPMPNQNFKLKPLENKLSWGLHLSWWVTMDFCLLLTSGFRPQIYPTANGVLGQGKWTWSHWKPLPWFLLSSHRSSSTSAHAREREATWEAECMASGVRPLCHLG